MGGGTGRPQRDSLAGQPCWGLRLLARGSAPWLVSEFYWLPEVSGALARRVQPGLLRGTPADETEPGPGARLGRHGRVPSGNRSGLRTLCVCRISASSPARQPAGADLASSPSKRLLVPVVQKTASLSFVFTDPSGFIFDVQSNTVMAQGGTFENMKEKVNVSAET